MPEGQRVRRALGVAVGFVVVSGVVLSTPAVPRDHGAIVASGPAGSSLTGPGSATPAWSAQRPSSASLTQGLPNASAPGLRVTATPNADNTLTMSETATFATPHRSVVLTPPLLGKTGAQYDRLRPVVSAVVVYIDNKYFMTVQHLGKGVTLTFPVGVRKVELTYVISGVFSTPAPGKPQTVTTLEPLLSSPQEELPVSYQVGGASTASILCPELPIFEQACGATSGVLSGLPSDASVVVITLGPATTTEPVQVDVPAAAAPEPPAGNPDPGPAADPGLPEVPTSTPSPPEPSSAETTTPSDTSTSTPAPVDPGTSPPTTPATDPPTAPPTEPPTSNPTTSEPPPSTDTPTTDPTTPIGTEKQPLGTEAMPADTQQQGPIGTEMRVADPTATTDPTDPSVDPTTDPSAATSFVG